MLYSVKPERIFLYCGIVDFRKQIAGLITLVESELGATDLSTGWFVFISRNKKAVKIIYWRGCGYALWHYKLEEELFKLGRPRRLSTKQILWSELEAFLNGKNIFEDDVFSEKKAKRMS